MEMAQMVENVDVSVIVPTKNEQITVGSFIKWCREGFLKAGLNGEIIFVDNSEDKTREIAESLGAKVIIVNQSGLGNAYRAAQGKALGEYVILGDADCTYDFRNLKPFLTVLDSGFDFVIGNRFKGQIEKGAMPFHHQYFGSPATSFVFKYGLGLPTGDIHCGMRAMTRDLYDSLPFLEGGWEYATEMIVSARNLNAKMAEVPINFFKEPEGRVSHHRRSSWLSPFRAGWGTLRVTATYLIDRVFVVPGLVVLAASSAINVLISAFRESFLKTLNLGLLAQSILMFASSIGAFMLTTGLLSRFAYRRELSSLNLLAKSKISSRLFSILVLATMIELTITWLVFYGWVQGLSAKVSQAVFHPDLVSLWLSFTSVYLCVVSVSIASLIGNHAHKFRK
jgi:glycosyltransferase involved in cell wall biosynthesis